MRLTFLGHAGFLIQPDRDDEVNLLVDPFLSGNPTAIHNPETIGCTHIALTHAHADHVGDTIAIAKRTGATVIAPFETGTILAEAGVSSVEKGNPGGTIHFSFGSTSGSITFTRAHHSSSYQGRYGGVACGLVIEMDGKRFYHTGDTDLFSDMRLIGELYQPAIAAVPIGDRFTMGPELAAKAAELIRAPRVIPIHYRTFPALVQNCDRFVPDGIAVVELAPGESVAV